VSHPQFRFLAGSVIGADGVPDCVLLLDKYRVIEINVPEGLPLLGLDMDLGIDLALDRLLN
jgi:hypothetical protein